MAYDRHWAKNRRAIATALAIWCVFQLLAFLKPAAITQTTADSHTFAGLAALTLLLAWPWVQRHFRKSTDETSPIATDVRHKTLVSLEFIALSVMLIYLLVKMPL